MGDVTSTVLDLPMEPAEAEPSEPSEGAAPSRISPSSAAMWEQCPRRWWYRYIDRLPEPPPGPHMVLGSFVHRILELLLDHPPEERTRDAARILARSVWQTEIVNSPEWASLDLSDEEALEFRRRAWSTVEAYFSFQKPSEVKPIERELEVLVEIDGVPFRGFIDLVEDEGTDGAPAVVVTDYKTGMPPRLGTPYTERQIAERLLQPLWYAAALEALGEHVPTRARLLYFAARPDASGTHLMHTHELSTPVHAEALAPAKAELTRRWEAIEAALDAGEATSRPGPLCGWCPYVDICSEGESECRSRWEQGRMRADAPAVDLLGISSAAGGSPTG